MKRKHICQACNGTGSAGTEERLIRDATDYGWEWMIVDITCRECGGRGWYYRKCKCVIKLMDRSNCRR